VFVKYERTLRSGVHHLLVNVILDTTEESRRTVDSDIRHFNGYNPANTMMIVMVVTPDFTIAAYAYR
jgi:hypothetical protein